MSDIILKGEDISKCIEADKERLRRLAETYGLPITKSKSNLNLRREKVYFSINLFGITLKLYK